MTTNWESIAHRLASALRRVEDEPFRLKNWHRAYDALVEYDNACRLKQREVQPEDDYV